MILPWGEMGTCPSNLFPSFPTGTTKSQSKRWCKSEEAPSFWEEPCALGPRSELQNRSHRYQVVRAQPGPPGSRSSWAHLTQQWWSKILRITENVTEPFTMDYGMYWVSTLLSHNLTFTLWGRSIPTNPQIYVVLRLKLNWCGCICRVTTSILLRANFHTLCCKNNNMLDLGVLFTSYMYSIATLKCKSEFRNTFGCEGRQIRGWKLIQSILWRRKQAQRGEHSTGAANVSVDPAVLLPSWGG